MFLWINAAVPRTEANSENLFIDGYSTFQRNGNPILEQGGEDEQETEPSLS